MVKFIAACWYQVFPFTQLMRANAKVLDNQNVPDGREARWVDLGKDKLLPILAEEWERAKHLDDKLYKLTTALSVAVAAVGVASKAVLDAMPTGFVKYASMAFLLYTIASLFAGVLMGFAGLRPKERAGYGPDFALKIRHDNRAAAVAIADALTHFEKNNIVRSNEATAANMAIRNGVIAFALVMTLNLFLPAQKGSPPPATTEYSSISISISKHDTSSEVAALPSAAADEIKETSASVASSDTDQSASPVIVETVPTKK